MWHKVLGTAMHLIIAAGNKENSAPAPTATAQRGHMCATQQPLLILQGGDECATCNLQQTPTTIPHNHFATATSLPPLRNRSCWAPPGFTIPTALHSLQLLILADCELTGPPHPEGGVVADPHKSTDQAARADLAVMGGTGADGEAGGPGGAGGRVSNSELQLGTSAH